MLTGPLTWHQVHEQKLRWDEFVWRTGLSLEWPRTFICHCTLQKNAMLESWGGDSRCLAAWRMSGWQSMKLIWSLLIFWTHVMLPKEHNASLSHRSVECDGVTGKFLIIKPTRCTNYSNLFWNETLHVSDSSSVHHQEFFTVITGMLHFIQVCRQLSSRIRMFNPDPARQL